VRRAYALHEHNGLARAQHWLHDDSPHGPAQFNEAILHAVHDFRIFLSHVLGRGATEREASDVPGRDARADRLAGILTPAGAA
jgi:hypothetical protein